MTLALPRGDLPDNGAVRLAPRFRICKPSARTRTRLNDIVRGRRGVTADTALRLPRRCLDVTRAEREFGFRATTPFDVGLRNTIEWYQSHRLSLQSGAS